MKKHKPFDPDEQIEFGEDGFPLEMEPDDLGDDTKHDTEFDDPFDFEEDGY